jgi:hypothetical protein
MSYQYSYVFKQKLSSFMILNCTFYLSYEIYLYLRNENLNVYVAI